MSFFGDWLPPSKWPVKPDLGPMLDTLQGILGKDPAVIFHHPQFEPVPKHVCDLMLRVEYGHLPPSAYWAVAFPDVVSIAHVEPYESLH
jgi:hypothetical protein